MSEATCDIGLIGLAVMGQNLVLNMNDHGFTVAVFNRTVAKVDEFIANEAKGTQGRRRAFHRGTGRSCSRRPRRVMLMVKAGDTGGRVDRPACCRISKRATSSSTAATRFSPTPTAAPKTSRAKGILFIGTGVSGGEEGARHGPSIMPGGNPAAWPHVKEIFQAIAAKVEDGTPCCDWVGEDGAGHYVKMVHNGIEYGDMQLICEAYQLLKDGLGLTRRRTARGLRRMEQGRARQLPDRDHRATSSPRRTKTARRWSTRFSTRRPEGHRQVDGDQRARPRHAGHADRRSGFRPLPLGAEGRARRGLEGPRRARRRRDQRRPRSSSSKTCAARSTLEDDLLRAGLHAAARGGQGARAGI